MTRQSTNFQTWGCSIDTRKGEPVWRETGDGHGVTLIATGAGLTGTRLLREWQGVEQIVTVTADGFEWQGRPYKSLSAIARAITGTRWNGWTFFGLKNHRGRR